MNEPWSKKHKRVFKGCRCGLSNSFAQPLSQSELVELTKGRGDDDLLEAYNHHSLEYTPNGGSSDLREEISKLYGEHISAENVLVFTGGQVAIQTAAMAFARDCHSIVFSPGYQSTVESPEWAPNSSVTKLERRASNRWQIDLDEVKRAVRPDTKYLVVNEPYNPGGIVMSSHLQRELVDLCREHGIIILSDEVYRLLEHNPEKDRIPAVADVYDRGISAVTMSKPWGACGVAIGWLACQDMTLIQRLVNVQYFGTACPSRASEIQALMVLRASDTILRDRLSILRRNLKLLIEFVEGTYGEFFEWTRPNAGAIAFVRFKGPLSTEELGNILAKRGISIKPAYCFTDEVTPEKDYFRVGFGERKMPLALQALTEFVEEHK